jgi:hypothetical protein
MANLRLVFLRLGADWDIDRAIKKGPLRAPACATFRDGCQSRYVDGAPDTIINVRTRSVSFEVRVG